jgi:hypothetical protein
VQPIPEWAEQQIEHDLLPFQKELGRNFLDRLFAQHGDEWYLVRVKVRNGKMTIQQSSAALTYEYTHLMVNPIINLHRCLTLPDIDFIFSMNDVFGTHTKVMDHIAAIKNRDPALKAWPIFMIAKHKEDPGMILMPDWYALKGFGPEKSHILKGNRKYSWESKKSIVFFRGSDNGAYNRKQWRECARPKLVALSLQNPDLIDARFSNLNCWEENSSIRDTIKAEGMVAEHSIPLKDILSHKYLIDIDGHTCTTPRNALLLYSNSVMLKQMTDNIQWYYRALIPYEHFLPVSEDLSDIFSQIAWAKAHDEECRNISHHANQLAHNVLSKEMIYLYFYRLLQAYAAKQQVYYNE